MRVDVAYREFWRREGGGKLAGERRVLSVWVCVEVAARRRARAATQEASRIASIGGRTVPVQDDTSTKVLVFTFELFQVSIPRTRGAEESLQGKGSRKRMQIG